MTLRNPQKPPAAISVFILRGVIILAWSGSGAVPSSEKSAASTSNSFASRLQPERGQYPAHWSTGRPVHHRL